LGQPVRPASALACEESVCHPEKRERDACQEAAGSKDSADFIA